MKDREPLNCLGKSSGGMGLYYHSEVRELEKQIHKQKSINLLQELTIKTANENYDELERQIEDLKSISPDHVSYLKALSEAETKIEAMTKEIERFIQEYSGDDLTGSLCYWLAKWQPANDTEGNDE